MLARILPLALRCAVSAALVLILSPLTLVGAAQGPKQGFDVASIRPNHSAGLRDAQFQFLPGGRLIVRNLPLSTIVAAAYDLPFQSPRLTGGTEWERSEGEKYDIEAVAPADAIPQGLPTKAREDKMRLMLQALLEDRFKLKIRIEPKEQPVYALVVAKGGPKLQKAKMQESSCEAAVPDSTEATCHDITGGMGRGIHGNAVSIADMANFVQNWTDRPVVDKTGLIDLFDIQTDGWVPTQPRSTSPDGQPVPRGDSGLQDPNRQTLADLFSHLGLRMESRRAVVDEFYVEHIQQPSAN